MTNFLSAGTGLSNIACSAEECLSWIIILLNILTVFYLVFCAWFKVTKTVKIIGYVWASALAVGTVAVVAAHACIFTILSAVFSALIIMAVLSVVFNKNVIYNTEENDESEKPQKISGAYVIHRTDDNKFVFLLYNGKKVAVSKSRYKYDSVDDVKKAIAVCRENGLFVAVENKTKSWIEFVNHPKFIMYEKDGKFCFHMTLADESIFLLSETFDVNELCEKAMNDAVSAVKSEKMYYSEKEVLAGSLFSSLPIAEEPVVVTEKPAPKPKPAPAPAPAPVAPAQNNAPEVAATESDDEEDETVVVMDEQGNYFRIRFNKSFTAKLMQSSDDAKRYYTELKNEILSYKKAKSRISWSYDSINAGRTPLVKFGIRGKTLCVYYSLNPDDYIDTKYKVEKMEAAKYEMVPCMYRIKNDRRLKYAKDLFAVVCGNLGLKKGEVPTEDYTLPYKPTNELVEEGLIKEVKVTL